jgi:hypothetical protein
MRREPFALVLDAGSVQLRVQRVARLASQPHTVFGWSVPDIADAVSVLTVRGVRFERFAGLTQDRNAIWSSPSGAKVAWFKDPDGNVLSLTESPTTS